MRESSRILVVNVNWIGDALFSTPALRAIKMKYPKCFLATLSPRRAVQILSENPHVDAALAYDDRLSAFRPVSFLKTLFQIRRMNFDAVILFHRSATKAFLVKAAGIPERCGYAYPRSRHWLTRTVELPEKSLHKVDFFLNLVGALGIEARGRYADFVIREESAQSVRRILENYNVGKSDSYAVVHAGGNWALKRWPAAYFARWIKLFRAAYPQWTVFLCGTESERGVVDQIMKETKDSRVISLCGELALQELGALFQRATLVLSNDSGPIHIAASQRAPLIGVFGPTLPELTGPVSQGRLSLIRKDVGCEMPCYFRACNYRVCMDLITPEEVLAEARKLIS